MAVDRICLEGLELQAPIGVYDHEKGTTQRLIISVWIDCDVRSSARSDDLSDTVDYDTVAALCRDIVCLQHHQLIETVAECIATEVLADARAQAVRVRVEKPGVVRDCRTVAVEVRRQR